MAGHWYLARTRSRGEYAARDQLSSLGVDVFMPSVVTPEPRPGRDDTPLFPSYLFVRFGPDEDRGARLRMVPPVIGLVTFGGEAPPVEERVIETIAERVDAINAGGGLRMLPEAGGRVMLTVGQTELPAEVVDHAAFGSRGHAAGRARVRVLLEFPGRQVPAEIRVGSTALTGTKKPVDRMLSAPVPRRTRGRGRWIQGYGARVAHPALASPA